MNNLTAVKETPDYLMKDITANIEISDSQLLKDLGTTGIPADKLDAFNLKAAAELKGMKANDPIPNNNNPLSGDKMQFGTGQNKVNLGNIIDAELTTKMIDSLVPALFVLILRVGAGVSVKKSQLQASQRELETMQPIVQKCLEVIEFNINNPFVALGIVMGVVYSTKAAEIGVNKFMDKEEGIESDNSEPREKKPRKPRSDAGQKRK